MAIVVSKKKTGPGVGTTRVDGDQPVGTLHEVLIRESIADYRPDPIAHLVHRSLELRRVGNMIAMPDLAARGNRHHARVIGIAGRNMVHGARP